MGVLQELRVAVRSLRRAPGFAAIAVLTLALGIGVTTAIFSVVYGVLLRPFPYRAPASLVIISAERTFAGQTRRANFSAAELDGWQQRSRAFDSLGLWGAGNFALQSEAGTEPIDGMYVSAGFFSTLGQPLAVGRPIGQRDDAQPVAVISHRLWVERFAADRRVLGRSITLSGRSYAVVGVAQPDFQFPSERVDVWTPLGYARAVGAEPWIDNPAGGGFTFVARLRDGVGRDAALRDAEAVARALSPDFPRISAGRRPILLGLSESLTAGVRPALLVLLAAVGLVLFVACANVTNLVLARQVSRSREVGVRRALGAPRGRLIASSIAESVIVALAGGVAGTVVAAALVRAFVRLAPVGLPRPGAIRVDLPVLVAALALSALAALLSGVAPAVQGLRADPVRALHAGGRAHSDGPGARRLRSALVVAELAISVVLLVAAGLLGRSLVKLMETDVGVRMGQALVAEMNFESGRTITAAQKRDVVDRLLARVSAMPGVRQAGVATSLPLAGARLRYTLKDVNTGTGEARDYDVDVLSVSPGFFRAAGLRLLAGRLFLPADDEAHAPVMIMSARTARRFFGDRDPVGRTLSLPGLQGGENAVLVGIVDDVKYEGLAGPADGGIYRPFRQQPWGFAYLVVRTDGEPTALAGSIRRAVASVDPRAATGTVQAFVDVLRDASAQPRFRATVIVAVAALALALAGIGLYGVVACSVAGRTAELGVRLALGATAADVKEMVVREGLVLGAWGVALGIPGAYGLARLLAGMLFGIQPADPASYGGAAIALLGVVALGSYVPARRAARVDPAVSLRAE